jgi:hypothetical protein
VEANFRMAANKEHVFVICSLLDNRTPVSHLRLDFAARANRERGDVGMEASL